jgi:hypothetical protein
LLTFALCIAGLFLIANRGAYRGFFSGDDFDNLANAREAQISYYGQALLKPRVVGEGTFRAVAHFYYFALVRVARLRYRPYVATIHLIHFFNIFLIWILARALGAARLGACAAATLFAFHATAFKIYWEPAYVFDLFAGRSPWPP